ncbi:MAG TPA: VTT domain-containing protein [Candidatus Acidoferrum sp.]|nr:VTT domain-containing protein [Candidatus Acidoferrum sp.]
MKLRLLINGTLIVVLAVAAVVTFTHQQETIAHVRSLLQSLDPTLAALILIGLFVLASLLMFPVSVLMILSGAYFGLWAGFGLNLLGFITGASITFLVARYLARELIAKLLPAKATAILDRLGNHGWKTVAVLRGVGVIPSVVINYAMSLTNIPLTTFIWASLAFTIPADFILTYAGVAGEAFVNGGDLRKLLIAAFLVAVAVIVAFLLRKRLIKT